MPDTTGVPDAFRPQPDRSLVLNRDATISLLTAELEATRAENARLRAWIAGLHWGGDGLNSLVTLADGTRFHVRRGEDQRLISVVQLSDATE